MSFEAENRGDTRGKASQSLFDSLRQSRQRQRAIASIPSNSSSPLGINRFFRNDDTEPGFKRKWEGDGAYGSLHRSNKKVRGPKHNNQDSVDQTSLLDSKSERLARDIAYIECDRRDEVKAGSANATLYVSRRRSDSRSGYDHSNHSVSDTRDTRGSGRMVNSTFTSSQGSRHVPSSMFAQPRSSPSAVIDLTLSDIEDATLDSPQLLQRRSDKSGSKVTQRPLSDSLDALLPSSPRADSKDPSFDPNRTCSCGKSTAGHPYIAICTNINCPHVFFHQACVGLGGRAIAPTWRCRECRPKPPPPSSQSTAIPSSPSFAPSQAFSHDIPDVTLPRGPPEPPLHPEQARVVDCILEGDNVFYTGSAGVGKSTVLKAFVQKLKQQGKHVDIIAPSGIAALNVGGKTVFAYAGWRPDTLKLPLHKIRANAHGRLVRKRLCKTDVLVIDEISMVERDLLVRLDHVMREARHGWYPLSDEVKMSPHESSRPFGGAQVVVTGDFCQLPPVRPFKTCMTCGGDDLPGHNLQDGRPLTCNRCQRTYEDRDKWAFMSDTWTSCEFRYFELKHIHRQNDKVFIDILQRCRYGLGFLPDQEKLLLKPKPDPVGAVKLLPRRDEVERENTRNFNSLKSQSREYNCIDCFIWKNKDEPDLQKKGERKYPNQPDGPLIALKDHRLEEEVKLKEGMLVILLVNLDFTLGLVNGSQGKIIGFEPHDEAKVFAQSAPCPSSSSLSDSSSRFKDRSSKPAKDAPSPEYIRIKQTQLRTFTSHQSHHPDQGGKPLWPIVSFHNGITTPIYPYVQLSELGTDEPYSLIGRTQVPLLAAWAITVHKSQGMTLERVVVDLWRSFEREMVYVALSRARGLEGLKVLRLPQSGMGRGGAGGWKGVNEEVRRFLEENGLGGRV